MSILIFSYRKLYWINFLIYLHSNEVHLLANSDINMDRSEWEPSMIPCNTKSIYAGDSNLDLISEIIVSHFGDKACHESSSLLLYCLFLFFMSHKSLRPLWK